MLKGVKIDTTYKERGASVNRETAGKVSKQTGTVLIMVIFISMLLAGSAAYLLARTRTEVFRQHYRKYIQSATQYAIGGMTIAMVQINSAQWIGGPSGESNEVLWAADPTVDTWPGSYIINNGTYSVRVNNLGNLWFELTSTGTAGDDMTGDIKRVVRLRVRDRDFFSRWSLFLENGDGIVDDTNSWYSDVHTNECLRFRNRKPEPDHARFYGAVTACNEPQDYPVWEVGGAATAEYFSQPPVWNSQPISLPPTTAFSTLKTLAETGAGPVENWGGDTIRVRRGPNGISIMPGNNFGKIEFKFEEDWHGFTPDQEVRIYYWDKYGDRNDTKIDIPHDAVIYCDTEIEGVEGEIVDRMTICSATGYIKISNDIEYEDRGHDHPYDYDASNPGDPNNFTPNTSGGPSGYNNNACLAIMAKHDILLSNHNGNDTDLIIHGVLAAGVGDPPMDGAIRWYDTTESGWNNVMADLRIYGAMIADGVMTSTGMVIGHFKGWSSGGVPSGGFTNSHIVYDQSLRAAPPPHFMEIAIAMYVGWEFDRNPPQEGVE